MLWLIWIMIMVIVPVLAGLAVWIELRHQPAEAPAPALGQPDDGAAGRPS